MNETFIEKCLSGDAFLDEIDDYIDAWHEGDSVPDRELHDYLGMTWEEYSLWMTKPSILGAIVSAKRKKIDVMDELNQKLHALAARANSQEEAQKMMNWLEKQGKV